MFGNNKEERFIWQQQLQGGNSGGGEEEVLYKTNFEYDAEQIIITATNDKVAEDDAIDITEEKQRLIDQRIHALSSIFKPRHHSNYDDRSTNNSSSEIHDATDLTDDQFIDFVLNGTPNTAVVAAAAAAAHTKLYAQEYYYSDQSSDDYATTISNQGMKQIIQKYQECRERKRNLANTYMADRRSVIHEPWVERDNDGEPSSVQIDRYGRLVRTRRESNNNVAAAAAVNDDDGEEEDAATESSNELELVDAAEAFWRQHTKSLDRSRSGGRRRNDVTSVPNADARPPPFPRMLQPQQPPQQLPHLPQNPLNQPHILERSIAQQMENESRQAIERAILRYRGQQQQHQHQQERDENIFELVRIPLIRPINEANTPRWIRFLSFNRQERQEQQHANDNNANENLIRQQIDVPNEQGEENHHWLDFRLALRRICFAVITVVAAFICIMLQGIPAVDFLDDGMEVDTIFLSGLMGPHYPGHHPQHQQTRRWVMQEMLEQQQQQEAGDVQQSIWNRLGVEDRYHLPRHATAKGAAAPMSNRVSNHVGGEL